VDFDKARQNVIEAIDASGNVAGSITGQPRLRDCLKQGYQYIAEVLSINKGACEVQVRAR
jgi:hypothetical protein